MSPPSKVQTNAAGDGAPVQVPVSNILKGVEEVVSTRNGPVTVTFLGDRSKSPCIAYHEVGLNHRSCFQSLLVASGPHSLLLRNYYMIFIDVPGHESPTAEVPAESLPLTLESLSLQLEDIINHYKLREVLGLGVGTGANVLIQYAARCRQTLAGLILISPSCKRPGWWEWGMGLIAARQLQHVGWTASAKEHLVQRLLGISTLQLYGGDSDLVKSMKRDMEDIPSASVAHYLRAALNRKDILSLVPHLKCRVLLVYGNEALYQQESLDLASAVDKTRFALIEVMDAGVLVNEEKPAELLSPLQLFLTALQLEGYGLGESMMVGQ